MFLAKRNNKQGSLRFKQELVELPTRSEISEKARVDEVYASNNQ